MAMCMVCYTEVSFVPRGTRYQPYGLWPHVRAWGKISSIPALETVEHHVMMEMALWPVVLAGTARPHACE